MTTDKDATANLVEALSDERILEIAVAHSNYREGESFEVFSHKRIIEFARDLAALQAPQEVGVVVKALEWRDHRGQTFPDTWTAQTPCGVYEIEERSASDSPAYVATGPLHVFLADKDSLEDAKAAAQADFEALSALSQPVATPAPSQDAAVAWPAERVCIPDPCNPDARIVGFRVRKGDEAFGEHGLSEPLFWLGRAVLAATRPAEAQAVAEGWRDMASAPKDGTRILLKVVTFAWSSDVCQHVATGDQAIEARWATWMNGDSDGAWHKWCGNARTFSTDGALVPLGWLPLPAASPATGGA